MQFIDLKAQYSKHKEAIDAAIQRVLDHGQYIMGPEVKKLEQDLRDFTGVKHCITCANGTDALQMLFMAYDIGSGDAVFTSDITFVASLEPACMLGATPVFCDIKLDTYNICPDSLERQVKAVIAEGKYIPKAVVAVDILGNPADYDKLQAICDKYELLLIQDAAQSFGATYKGKKCGSFGHAATTSFFPAKPLGCYGDGGAIFTNDGQLVDVLESIRVHGKGSSGKYANIRVGVNSRLDTIQAAILIEKFKAFAPVEIDVRQVVARRYNDAFVDKFVTPFVERECLSVYAQYALLASDTLQRDRIIKHLSDNGIPNMVYYPTPQHMLPVYSSTNSYGESFVNSNDYCVRTFSLPMHPYLEEKEQQLIISTVLEA